MQCKFFVFIFIEKKSKQIITTTHRLQVTADVIWISTWPLKLLSDFPPCKDHGVTWKSVGSENNIFRNVLSATSYFCTSFTACFITVVAFSCVTLADTDFSKQCS